MMPEDPVVAEIRKVRQANAERFNFDLEAIVRDLMEKEATSGRQYVRYPSRPPRTRQKNAVKAT